MSNLTHNWKGSQNYRGRQVNFRCSESEKALLDATMVKFNEIMQKKEYSSRHLVYGTCDVAIYLFDRFLQEMEAKDAKTIQDDFIGHGIIDFFKRQKQFK